MARPPRVEFPGALYHVIVRGNERKAVFRDDADRELYLRRLAHYRERFQFRLIAYCMMTNHVHLAVETGEAPLSRVIHGLQSSYTQAFNRRHQRSGHLFQGRYKTFLVDADRYFLALLRYIHRYPLEARLTERTEDYAWSSDRFYRRGRGPDWLDLDRGYFLMGARRANGARRYRQLMGEAESERYDEIGNLAQTFKGDEVFVEKVMQKVEVPELIRRALRVEQIARAVADDLRLDLPSLRTPSRRVEASRARAITAFLGKLCGRIPYSKTAAFFNRDASSIAKDVFTFDLALRHSKKIREQVDALANRLIKTSSA
jgi:REP element-mobilizing transposase RayT